MDFYNDPLPWTPSRILYPTNDDVVRYYLSRVTKKNHVKNVTICQLAEFVRGIWEEGDGCPLVRKAIPNLSKISERRRTWCTATWSQEKKD